MLTPAISACDWICRSLALSGSLGSQRVPEGETGREFIILLCPLDAFPPSNIVAALGRGRNTFPAISAFSKVTAAQIEFNFRLALSVRVHAITADDKLG